jgi:hypothetical protein
MLRLAGFLAVFAVTADDLKDTVCQKGVWSVMGFTCAVVVVVHPGWMVLDRVMLSEGREVGWREGCVSEGVEFVGILRCGWGFATVQSGTFVGLCMSSWEVRVSPDSEHLRERYGHIRAKCKELNRCVGAIHV